MTKRFRGLTLIHGRWKCCLTSKCLFAKSTLARQYFPTEKMEKRGAHVSNKSHLFIIHHFLVTCPIPESHPITSHSRHHPSDFALSTELKAFMARIWTLNFRSYNILLDLQTRVPREFEPCWIQEPLTLTDALGRVVPVHLELINSWDVLESVLTARFRNIAGERKVKQGEYALQDRLSMRDIERSQAFEANFLPCRKIDMSIIFCRRQPTGNSCPGCKMESKSDGATATTW
jgi:hypothetical protein